MKGKPPNPDGSLGFTLSDEDSIPARLWNAYFESIRYPAGLMCERLRAGKGYMVPTQTPQEFDRGWRVPRLSQLPRPKTSSQMTPEERQRVINRLAGINPLLAQFARRPADDREAAE